MPRKTASDVCIGIAVSPFWYPWTVVALGVWPKEIYEEIFGVESQLFYETESEE